jgi:hypothetical protein
LIEDLKKKKQLMPRHVLFCETIADVSKLYAFFVGQFGSNCDLIDMFHSKTNDKIKEKIRNDMAVDGKIRLLICTNSKHLQLFHKIKHGGALIVSFFSNPQSTNQIRYQVSLLGIHLLVSFMLVLSGDSTITSLLPVKQRCFIIFLLWASPICLVTYTCSML